MTTETELDQLREAVRMLELAAITLARRLPRDDPARIAACKVIARYGNPLAGILRSNETAEKEIKAFARSLGFELDAAPKCPKCGASMVHARLKGFVCQTGC